MDFHRYGLQALTWYGRYRYKTYAYIFRVYLRLYQCVAISFPIVPIRLAGCPQMTNEVFRSIHSLWLCRRRETQQSSGFLLGVWLVSFIADLVSFPCGRLYKGMVGYCIKINGVGTSVIPTSANTGISHYFVIGYDLNFRTYKLLCFAGIGGRLFTQEEAGVNQQGF